MNKSKAAFLFTCRKLAEQALYMWTFTLAELLNIKDTQQALDHFLERCCCAPWQDRKGFRLLNCTRRTPGSTCTWQRTALST